MLQQVAEKVLPQAIKPGVLAYCPTMDLVAVATRDEQVHVFRFNGQRVFGVVNRDQQCKILKLTWKPNGRILAVAQSTGAVLLLNSHTGKVVHQLQCRPSPSSSSSSSSSTAAPAAICALSWGVNFMEAAVTRARVGELGKEVTLDDVVSRGLKSLDPAAPLDLPADLAFLDIESVLPKLSTLPAAGKEDDVFASRVSLDAMFHPSKKEANEAVDVLLVGFEDGVVHLSIYDSFEIGSFEGVLGGEGTRALQCCSHPYSSTYGLLVGDKTETPTKLEFVPADLRLIPDTGRYLSLLASKATQLQNLLRYMKETQLQMYTEFKSAHDLPSKFIRNIEETLQEKEGTTFMNAAYHLVATGHCSPSMKEWLVDELSERGHKRWDKATTSGYENVNRFTQQNLIPVLDRFGVLVSRLRGLSKFQESTSGYGLDTTELDHVLDTLTCLLLHCHTVLLKSAAELRQFIGFTKWMKLEIEMQTAEVGSQTAEDVAAKYSTLDYPLIFQFIQGAMQNSELYDLFDTPHLNPSTPIVDERPLWEVPPETTTMYESYKDVLKASQDGSREQKMPGLSKLLERLTSQCKLVFERIAVTQKRKVRYGKPLLLLEDCEVSCFDSRSIPLEPQSEWDLCRYFVASVIKGQPKVILWRMTCRITNGVSSIESVDYAAVKLEDDALIKDVQFADDETLLIARKSESSSDLIYFPYNGLRASQAGLVWTPDNAGNEPDLALDDEDAIQSLIRHKFAEGPATSPLKLAANGRKARRAVCVVAEDGIHYRVFDMDTGGDYGERDHHHDDNEEAAEEGGDVDMEV